MTLNSIIHRIRTICLSHKQVRSFYRGFGEGFLADHTRKYPAVVLEETGGTISITGGGAIINFRLSFWDLVNVAADTKINEQDIDSDMVSVALDIIAQLNYGGYSDWRISVENALQLVLSEQNDDMYGGCTVDFTVKIMFKQDLCAVPSELFYIPGESGGVGPEANFKLVYDLNYIATGTEGFTLTIPTIGNRKVLFVTRESSPIYKVSNSPDSSEYTWNNADIVLGSPALVGERFLILYRNY